jgi:hypothetical protein
MKTIVRASYLLCLLVLFCSNLNGQVVVGKIYGTVIDKQSQTTLPGVNILVYSKDKRYGTTSDANGLFKLENIPVGRFWVEFSLIGYEKLLLQNVSLTSAKDLFLNIELLEKVEEIDEIVIKARTKDKAINEFAMTSARLFTVEESNNYAGSWGDPARMVSNFAGVVTAGDQRNDIIIRGNSPTGLLWRLDGIAIPNPNHFGSFGTTGGPICMLNNNQLANSDFFTGAFPSEFGNALSGVFDLKMRKGNSQKHEFLVGTGFNGFELGAEGPILRSKGSSYMVNFRYTMMDLMAAMGMFDVGGIPKYADLSFKVFVPTKKLGTFSLIGVGGKSRISLEDEEGSISESGSGWTSEMLPGTKVKSGSEMGVIGITNNYFISERSRIESSVSASYTNSFNQVDSLGEIDYFNFYNENYSETTCSFSTKYTLKGGAKNTLQVGFSANYYDFNFLSETYFHILNRFIPHTDTRGDVILYQAFFQQKNRLTNALTVNWGLHGQLFGLNNTKMIEPRLGLNYSISSKQSVSLGYGLHGQIQPRLVYFTQTLNDLENSVYELTNRELDFSKNHHFVAGYDMSISKNMRFKMEAYYQCLYDIPVEKRVSTFSMVNYGANFHNENEDSLTNSGSGKNVGIELTLEKYLSKNFYFLLTTSLYDSKYRGSDQVWRNTAFNGNYTVNFLTGYELPIKNDVLAINIKMVWAGGKRYIPIDLESSFEKGEAVYDYDNAYSLKYNDYFRTDFRISFRQNLKRISQEWSFDVQNLTNHLNIFTQRYDANSKQLVNVLQMKFFPIGSWKIYF